MKRKLLLSLALSFVMVINIVFVANVKAYEENAFTDEKCITSTSWMNTAKTAYTLNQSTGLYQLSGQSYNDYKSSGLTGANIFYRTSGDQRILYAYVPEYNQAINSQTIKNELKNRGIIVTKECSGTLVVAKTIVGNPPTESSYEDIDEDETNQSDNDATDSNDNTDSDMDDDVEKKEAPNTASPMATAAIIASITFVAVAVYSLLRKIKPELFNKRN